MRQYREVLPISRGEAEKAFASCSPDLICDALIAVVYHDPDWHWVQERCICFASHPNLYVRGLATTCFGHLARIHGDLDIERVLPVLKRLLKDPDVSGEAEVALDDIEIFLPHKRASEA